MRLRPARIPRPPAPPRPGRPAAPLRFALLLTLAITLSLTPPFSSDLATEAALAVGCALLAAISLTRLSVHGIYSLPGIYILALSLFHIGIPITLLASTLLRREPDLPAWYFDDSTRLAVRLATIAIVAFAAGAHAARIWLLPTRPARVLALSPRHTALFAPAGLVLLTLTIAYWCALVASHGLLFGSYGDYFTTWGVVGASGFEYATIAWGLVLILAPGPSRLSTLGLTLFAAWALLAFPLGLRGDVLFPLTAGLAVAARYRRPLSAPAALALALAILTATAVVKDLRTHGLREAASAGIALRGPLAAVQELGGSIVAVVATIQWREGGDPPLLGSSYWAPFDRALGRLMPGWPRLAARDDPRLLGKVVQVRWGAVGFSTVAEAYYNFDTPGVLLVMFVTGLLLGRLDRWPVTPLTAAVCGMLMYPLLYHVRNSFLMVPVTAAEGLALILILVLLARPFRRSAAPATAAPLPLPHQAVAPR